MAWRSTFGSARSAKNTPNKGWPTIARVDLALTQKANPHPRFADCAARYLAQSQNKRSVDVTAWHVRRALSRVPAWIFAPRPELDLGPAD